MGIGEVAKPSKREFKRDYVPLLKFLPLPLQKGKGDTGGWGWNNNCR